MRRSKTSLVVTGARDVRGWPECGGSRQVRGEKLMLFLRRRAEQLVCKVEIFSKRDRENLEGKLGIVLTDEPSVTLLICNNFLSLFH